MELWSEDDVQHQLQETARNDPIFHKIARDLVRSSKP